MKSKLTHLCVLLVLSAGCFRSPSEMRSPSLAPPQADMSKCDPRVRERFLQLRSSVEAQPTSDNWGKLGQAFQALELNNDAEFCYQNAVRLDPQSARWNYLLGMIQLPNKPELAFTNLAMAVSLAATNDTVRLAYAKALVERGSSQQAAEQFDILLRQDANHPVARLELARIKLAAGESQPAAQLLAPCLTNQYTARPARLLLGQVKLKSGDSNSAAQLVQSAATLPKPFDWPDPFLREVRNILPLKANALDQANVLLSRERSAEAETLLLNLHRQEPDDPDVTLLLGRLKSQQKRFEEAETFFKSHLSARTNSVQGWMQLGIARFRAEQWAGAAEAFQRVTEIKPDYAEAQANLGLAHSRLNQPLRAIPAFEAALRAQPGDARTLVSLAEERLKAGLIREAAQAAEKALMINPQDARALRVKDRAR